MLPQIDNKVMSSILLWVDHTILDKGSAYTNVSGLFYRIGDVYNGYYTYALPFKQIIADSSINQANILSGIYLNNNFIRTGQSGLLAINYDQGQVYFSQNVDNSSISGRYSIKDYNIYLTAAPEEKLLFETKYEVRPKVSKPWTGLQPQTMTYPAIFIKKEQSSNEPFAFGGTDTTTYNVRCIVISDSQFSLDAVESILRDKVRTFIPFVEENQMPFSNYGDVKGDLYNYNSLTTGQNNVIFISRVDISRLSQKSVIMNEVKDLNPNVFPSIMDLELEIVRNPRV